MSRRSKIVLIAAGAVAAVLPLAGVGWIVVNSRDIAPADTSDLVPDVAELPTEDNAYTHFRAAFKVLDWPKKDLPVLEMISGRTWDDAFVADLLAQNREALDLFERGLACPGYQVDGTPGHDQAGFHWRLLEMCRLVALKASRERRTKEMGQAWDTCADLLRCGSLITTNPPGVIGYAAGVGILNYGFDEAERLLREDSPDENRLRGLLDQLNRIAPLESGWVRAIKAEFQFISTLIDKSFPKDSPRRSLLAGYTFQPERTKDSFAGFCRMEIANISLPYAEMSLPRGKSGLHERLDRLQLLLRPNSMARGVLPAPDYLNGFLRKTCSVKACLAGLRLVVACRLYEIRHGRLPESLETLVPEFLPEVPCDPFDGKPFRYLHDLGRVYSVGPDLKDSQVRDDASSARPAQPVADGRGMT